MEDRVRARLRRASRRLSPRRQLAVTCALEHFTALLGQLVLENPRMLEGADPTMAGLWRWHSAEENEHKAVAFDVFLAAGGTYAERVITMVVASVVFWAKVLEHQARMMKSDGTLWSLSEWTALAQFLFVQPGGLRAIVPRYFAYYRPGFHPNDVDSSGVLEAWKRAHESASAAAA